MGRGEVGAFQALEPARAAGATRERQEKRLRERGERRRTLKRHSKRLVFGKQLTRDAKVRCKLLKDGSAENARKRGRNDSENPGGTALPSTARRERTVGTVAPAATGKERGERASEAESAGPSDGLKKRTREGRAQGRHPGPSLSSRKDSGAGGEDGEGHERWAGRGQQWRVTPSVGCSETHALSGRQGGNAMRVLGAQGQVRGAGCKGAWSAQDCPS